MRQVRAVDLYLLMSALALFRITNAPTVLVTSGVDLRTVQSKEHATDLLVSMVLPWLRTPDPAGNGLVTAAPKRERATSSGRRRRRQ